MFGKSSYPYDLIFCHLFSLSAVMPFASFLKKIKCNLHKNIFEMWVDGSFDTKFRLSQSSHGIHMDICLTAKIFISANNIVWINTHTHKRTYLNIYEILQFFNTILLFNDLKALHMYMFINHVASVAFFCVTFEKRFNTDKKLAVSVLTVNTRSIYSRRESWLVWQFNENENVLFWESISNQLQSSLSCTSVWSRVKYDLKRLK